MPHLNLAKGFRRIKKRFLMTDVGAIRLTLCSATQYVGDAPHDIRHGCFQVQHLVLVLGMVKMNTSSQELYFHLMGL